MTLRVFKILHYLETSRLGLRVGEIHERLKQDQFEVDKRTIYRDLELLQQAYIPLQNEGQGPDSRWRLAPFAQINQHVSFTYQEIFALYVARKSLDHLNGTPLHEPLTSLFTKIEKVLGTDTEAFQEFLNHLSFRPQGSWSHHVGKEVLDTVYQALEEGHVLKMTYRAEAGAQAGEYAERRVGPECLYFANGGIYLIAKDLNKAEPRTYALSRVGEAEMLVAESYEKEGLSPEHLFKESFGLLNQGEPEWVEILLQGPVAAFVAERRWHESQEIQKTSSGLVLKMRVRINDELARWVLGLGPSAQVLAPSGLASLVESMAGEVLSLYQSKAS